MHARLSPGHTLQYTFHGLVHWPSLPPQVFRDEGLIYMVLEHGDIDLARLLHNHEEAHRQGAGADGEMDENFVRLYWQQMLQVGGWGEGGGAVLLAADSPGVCVWGGEGLCCWLQILLVCVCGGGGGLCWFCRCSR